MARKITSAERNTPTARRKLTPEEMAEQNAKLKAAQAGPQKPTPEVIVPGKVGGIPQQALTEQDILKRMYAAQSGATEKYGMNKPPSTLPAGVQRYSEKVGEAFAPRTEEQIVSPEMRTQ